MTNIDPLAERFAALTNTNDTSDWSDVRHRARAFDTPRSRIRRRAVLTAVAAAVMLPAGAVGAAAVGLGGPLDGLFGGEPEANFRYHDGKQIPIYMGIRPEGQMGSRAVIDGKVWMAGVASLELRFANGSTAAVPLDARGFFRYEPAVGSEPVALIARNAQGDEVYSVPIPVGHTASPAGQGSTVPPADER